MHRSLALALGLAACVDAPPSTAPRTAIEANVVPAAAATRAYDVTITNLTTGQPFSPGVLVTHTKDASVFHVGDPASQGVRLIAENGDQSVAIAELTGQPGVFQVVNVDAPIGRVGGPLPTSRTFRIETGGSANRLSLAVMLICTNDGFTGLDGVKLPGGFQPDHVLAAGYDAGTEANDERSPSIVDPCYVIGPSTGPADGNARPATSGLVAHHPGILGGADLSPSAHGWENPVARITIQRVR